MRVNSPLFEVEINTLSLVSDQSDSKGEEDEDLENSPIIPIGYDSFEVEDNVPLVELRRLNFYCGAILLLLGTYTSTWCNYSSLSI